MKHNYQYYLEKSGLDDPENWRGDPRDRFITLLSSLVEDSPYYLNVNTTDTKSKILELRESPKRGGRLIGFDGKRDHRIGVFMNHDAYDEVAKTISLPENGRPEKKQPHFWVSLEKLWDIICVLTGNNESLQTKQDDATSVLI